LKTPDTAPADFEISQPEKEPMKRPSALSCGTKRRGTKRDGEKRERGGPLERRHISIVRGIEGKDGATEMWRERGSEKGRGSEKRAVRDRG
jgi:hypothetical protein